MFVHIVLIAPILSMQVYFISIESNDLNWSGVDYFVCVIRFNVFQLNNNDEKKGTPF